MSSNPDNFPFVSYSSPQFVMAEKTEEDRWVNSVGSTNQINLTRSYNAVSLHAPDCLVLGRSTKETCCERAFPHLVVCSYRTYRGEDSCKSQVATQRRSLGPKWFSARSSVRGGVQQLRAKPAIPTTGTENCRSGGCPVCGASHSRHRNKRLRPRG